MSKNAILDEKHHPALIQFRKAVSDILRPDRDDDYLLRWLVARDFDFTEAEKMIRKNHKFMYNIEAEDILDSDYELPEIWEKYMPTRFWGFDKEGSGVRFFFPGRFDFKGFIRSLTIRDLTRIMTYIIQSDLRRAKKNAEKTGKFNQKTLYLLDFKDFNIQQFLDKIVITKGIQLVLMYQDNFPELLKDIYVINMPPFLPKAMAIFKPFFNERTWAKFRFYSSDEWKDQFLNGLDTKIVPRHYGGELSDPYYDPDVFIPRIITVPDSWHIKNELLLKLTDSRTKEIFVPQHHAFSYKVNIRKVETILKWIFQSTKGYNIKFGVFFQMDSQGNEDENLGKELIKSEFVDSYYIPERGELLCEKAGKYILHFDNTYSWLVKKHLLLRVDIEDPVD